MLRILVKLFRKHMLPAPPSSSSSLPLLLYPPLCTVAYTPFLLYTTLCSLHCLQTRAKQIFSATVRARHPCRVLGKVELGHHCSSNGRCCFVSIFMPTLGVYKFGAFYAEWSVMRSHESQPDPSMPMSAGQSKQRLDPNAVCLENKGVSLCPREGGKGLVSDLHNVQSVNRLALQT